MNNTFSLLSFPESRGQVVISIYRIGLFDTTPTRPSPPAPLPRLTSKWPGVGSYLQKTPDYSSKTNSCAFSSRSRQLAQKFKAARINHPNLQKWNLQECWNQIGWMTVNSFLQEEKKTENKNRIIYR